MSSYSSTGYRGWRGGARGANLPGHSGRGRGGVPPVDRATVPRGICAFYWSSGACDRGFDCTFKHEVKPEVQASSSPTQPTDYTPDFFSLEGLAINNGSIADSQHNLSPSEAHNHLRSYLFDNYVFRDAINVECFSRIFASVNSRNRAWVGNRKITLMSFLTRSDRMIGFQPGSGQYVFRIENTCRLIRYFRDRPSSIPLFVYVWSSSFKFQS